MKTSAAKYLQRIQCYSCKTMFYKNIASLSISVFTAFVLGRGENLISWRHKARTTCNVIGVAFKFIEKPLFFFVKIVFLFHVLNMVMVT